MATGTYREDIILKWPQNRCEGSEISLSLQTCPIRYLESQFSPCQYPGSVCGPYQLQSKTAASGHACIIKRCAPAGYVYAYASTLIRLRDVISNAHFLGLTEQGLDGDEEVIQTM